MTAKKPKKLTKKHVQNLYRKYLELAKYETETLGFKATEIRHLIGRLGEFYCALQVNGMLVKVVNKSGYDVISSDGIRISVKTTAQKSNFISITASTAKDADELMLVQYSSGKLSQIYYGPMRIALQAAKYIAGANKYELTLKAARELQNN